MKVWDLETGTERFSLEGHDGGVRAVAVTANGRYAISGSDDHTLKVWMIASSAVCAALNRPQERILPKIPQEARGAFLTSWNYVRNNSEA